MSDLLALALDGHGGLGRWRQLTWVTATLTANGALFAAKGHEGGFGTVSATIDVTTPRLRFEPFLGFAEGRFQPDRVTVTTRSGSQYHRDNPRAACLELAPDAPWDDLHLLYFTGYALWNYLCAPFLLTGKGFAAVEIAPWAEDGQTWRRLRVDFPEDVPTHSAEQVFYFDDRGLLRRLDYVPEILGRSGHAAHYCYDHRDFSGLMVPTRRRVYARREDGTPDREITFVEIEISEVCLSNTSPAVSRKHR